MVSLSQVTYLVRMSYFEIFFNPEIMDLGSNEFFNANKLLFYVINCKTVTILFYLLITQLQV